MTSIFALLVALATPQASQPAPSSEAKALLRDLSNLVLAAEWQIWHIDYYEVEGLVPNALHCVCRADTETLEAAQTWLEAKVERLGGPPERAWSANGADLSAIKRLLTADRTRQVLVAARAVAKERCPFWMHPSNSYVDRHRPAGRITFNFDGGGLFTATRLDGELRLGGGGSGRLSIAYGLNERWSIRSGPELGGAGLLDNSLETEDIKVTAFAAIMTSIRRRYALWHWDVEAGPITAGVPWRDVQRYGGRLGTIIGLTYPRIARVQPWAGVRAALDYLPAQGGEVSQWVWRSGFRVGFDLYPSD